ncbi:MAG: hypothetical protein WBM98_06180, partial [Maribacter sp.]|uniref:hypothetical protein n=1 Tax=Maribacter sp. TaxID=1897614 RepID=UPI003C773109
MKQVFIIGTLIALLTSCANDTDDNQTTLLEGKWVLTNVYCYCAFGDNPDFSGHALTFKKTVLRVENTEEFKFLTNAAGNFTLNSNVITFQNGQHYTYELKSDVLELTFVD